MMKRLKYLILSIIIFGFSIISFSYGYSSHTRNSVSLSSNGGSFEFSPGMCMQVQYANSMYFSGDNGNYWNAYALYCVDYTGYVINGYGGSRSLYYYTGFNSSSCSDCPTCDDCPDISSCPKLPTNLNVFGVNLPLSGYDQVVLDGFGFSYIGSSITTNQDSVNYVVSLNNDLAGTIGTGDSISTGDNWSALYINEIQHSSAPLINITIPEEFDWSYTGNDEQFDLNISGYNVDTEYIDGIIRNQTTLPNDVDFNNIVKMLIPAFIPGLVIILFLVFVFRFIKKVF